MIVLVEVLTALAGDLVTSPLLDAVISAVEVISPTVASILAFALVYRLSTRLRPSGGDVWPATLVAALALASLAWGYGLYMRVYGSSSAAGAVVLGLAFVYYSAQILLYGAEVISTCANRRGRPLQRTSDQADDE
jgi:membrane protein